MNRMRIGWIGLGVMGAPMAGHLLAAGHELRVHTRSKHKADALLAAGAVWAASPAEAADGADVACSMVGLPEEVEAVHLGLDGSLAAQSLPPLLIDFSTSPRSLAVRIAAEASSRGVASLDAPVSGGDIGARNATLSVMVGGTVEAFEAAAPIFQLVGKRAVHMGGPGSGQATKAVNQVLVAASCVGMGEALAYAHAAGLDLAKVVEAVSAGAAGSWTLTNLAPRALREDWSPGFMVDHLVKDLRIVLADSAEQGVSADLTRLAEGLYAQIQASGGGQDGTQAIARHMLQASRG